jgi:predicted molibdopterin-dependent oxidoreductase YjgC
MSVRTDTDEIQRTRATSLELLFASHPEDCFTCTANMNCELLHIANHIGLDRTNLSKMRVREEWMPIDSSNPFFTFDPNKCVLCGICVRTCDEIQGIRAIDYVHRGYETKIGTFGDKLFIDSTCESCGECVERCPVGALERKNYRRPAYEVESICSYCGVGCGLLLGVQGDEIVNVRGNPNNPTNIGQLCVKGRFGYKFVNHPDRVKKPMVRQYLLDGKKKPKTNEQITDWVEVDWDTAYDIVAQKFVEIIKKHGADAIGVLASAKCTNEENYLFQKFARQVVGTHSIDHCARL